MLADSISKLSLVTSGEYESVRDQHIKMFGPGLNVRADYISKSACLHVAALRLFRLNSLSGPDAVPTLWFGFRTHHGSSGFKNLPGTAVIQQTAPYYQQLTVI